MSTGAMQEFLETVAIWLIQVSIVLLVWLAITEHFRPPRLVRRFRRWRAASRLRRQLQGESSATSTVVYWDRYRHLSRLELFAVAGEFDWLYTGQQVVPDGWELQFAKAG